ncbi:MAG: hypothetical protein Q7J57_12755, partial [Gemmobacter sp.]|nr:hypothetical protein [Gemmobacter sp.]
MTGIFTRLMTIAAMGAFLAIAPAAPLVPMAQAQQVNPTANAVTEDKLLQALTGDQMVAGRVSIPDDRSAGLIKPGNKGWAATHNS